MITSRLFEAFLACPTKCFLRSIGQSATENTFTSWKEARDESYRREGFKRLSADLPGALDPVSVERRKLKNARWQLAFDQVVRAQNLEASIHVVQRIPVGEISKSAKIIPIRFVPTNKLSQADRLIAAFEAHVLQKAAGVQVGLAKIVHGDNWSTFKLKTSTVSREVERTLKKVTDLLADASPPDFILNRHCPECEFRDFCRERAVQKDDLSLLSGMTKKERLELHAKGIFTVNQLSYTFRPRRRSKRFATKPERYHHSLRALAIRAQRIHVVGSPRLEVPGTPLFFDVEGLPDRDFYYVIGFRLEHEGRALYHHLWADAPNDEELIWKEFLGLLSEIDNPVLLHYGSYESSFLKKMCQRYGGPPQESAVGKSIASSVNLLSFVFAQVYFPSYSSGLKETARFLGFKWTDPLSSGLQSIVWRHQWEESHDPTIREKLIRYNADDCEALAILGYSISHLTEPTSVDKSTDSMKDVVRVDSLEALPSKWRVFKSPIDDLVRVNSAAHWNYQRDRVFIRTEILKKKPSRRSRTRNRTKKTECLVVLSVLVSCPKCGRPWPKKCCQSRTVQDLVFGRDSLKRRLVQYLVPTYRCRSCRHCHPQYEWYLRGHARKWGWNVVAYFIYHIIRLRVPQRAMERNLNTLFGFGVGHSTLNNFKTKVADYYLDTRMSILNRIIHGSLIHADETQANITGQLAYVWVLTNLREVIYVLAESREAEFIHKLLKDFNGVLVSDFYAAYDAIDCPQQKCLIHLMRDLNDEMLSNPFDEEMKAIGLGFAGLLKPIIETIDRRGLKKYFLRKH
jgi:predicted RecB family nuclease